MDNFGMPDPIFASKWGEVGVPEVKIEIFWKVGRNELKIGGVGIEFYGEFESEVGFEFFSKSFGGFW